MPNIASLKARLRLSAVVCSALLCLSGTAQSAVEGLPQLNSAQRQQIGQIYGSKGINRIDQWLTALPQWRKLERDAQVRAVNDFFNQLVFMSDSDAWRAADYWATPLEFLSVGAGDCEDYAIAKYFSLRALGIPDEQLRITYVNSLTLQQAHMVLGYYPEPKGMGYLLDNFDKVIKPANERPDLVTVYIFNAGGLWRAHQRGEPARIGDSGQIQRWGQLLERMKKEQQP